MDRRQIMIGIGSLAAGVSAAAGLARDRGRLLPSPVTVAPSGGGNTFPNVVLYTQEYRAVRFYDDLLKGRIVIINFMYVQCGGICPVQTANLVRVQQTLGARVGQDVFMYSLTLKPDQDSPDALKRYADMHGAGPGWSFLTGRKEDVELVRRKLGFVDPDPEVDAVKSSHLGMTIIGNEAMGRWMACPSLSAPNVIVAYLDGISMGAVKSRHRISV